MTKTPHIIDMTNIHLLEESDPDFARFLDFCNDHSDIPLTEIARFADARIRYNISKGR